jgi:ParB/RepB/Spo0J family partition protein
MQIKNLPVRTLTERTDKNPNVMSAEDYGHLVEAIKRFGFLQPVLVREVVDDAGDVAVEIVDGVHRVRAAKECELDIVPCVIVTDDEDAAVALRIGMNRLRGDLDLAIVAEQMLSLNDDGWTIEALTVTGYSEKEINDMLAAATPTGEEDLAQGGVGATEDSEDGASGADGDHQTLEILLPSDVTKSQLTSIKRRLRKAGDGDLGKGFMAMLDAAQKLAEQDAPAPAPKARARRTKPS